MKKRGPSTEDPPVWALQDLNLRPLACEASALNP